MGQTKNLEFKLNIKDWIQPVGITYNISDQHCNVM